MANDNVITLQIKRGDKVDLVNTEHNLEDGEIAFSRNTVLAGHQNGREVLENYLYIGDSDATGGYACFSNSADMLTVVSHLSREVSKLKRKMNELRSPLEIMYDGTFFNKGIIYNGSDGALALSDANTKINLADATARIKGMTVVCSDVKVDLPTVEEAILEYAKLADPPTYAIQYIFLSVDDAGVPSLVLSDLLYDYTHTPDDFAQYTSAFRGLDGSSALRLKNYNNNYDELNNESLNAWGNSNTFWDLADANGQPAYRMHQLIVVGHLIYDFSNPAVPVVGINGSYYGTAKCPYYGPLGGSILGISVAGGTPAPDCSATYYARGKYNNYTYFVSADGLYYIWYNTGGTPWTISTGLGITTDCWVKNALSGAYAGVGTYTGTPTVTPDTTVVTSPIFTQDIPYANTEFRNNMRNQIFAFSYADYGDYSHDESLRYSYDIGTQDLTITCTTDADCIRFVIVALNSYKDWPFTSVGQNT